MKDWTKFYVSFWASSTVQSVPAASRLVMVNLMTCEASADSYTGAFRLTEDAIAGDTGLGVEQVRQGIADAERVGFIRLSTDRRYVWVVESSHYQSTTDKAKFVRALFPRVRQLAKRCPELAREWAARYWVELGCANERSLSALAPPDSCSTPPDSCSTPPDSCIDRPLEGKKVRSKKEEEQQHAPEARAAFVPDEAPRPPDLKPRPAKREHWATLAAEPVIRHYLATLGVTHPIGDVDACAVRAVEWMHGNGARLNPAWSDPERITSDLCRMLDVAAADGQFRNVHGRDLYRDAGCVFGEREGGAGKRPGVERKIPEWWEKTQARTYAKAEPVLPRLPPHDPDAWKWDLRPSEIADYLSSVRETLADPEQTERHAQAQHDLDLLMRIAEARRAA